MIMTMYMMYRKEQNAYSNAHPTLVGVYFDKERAKTRMRDFAEMCVEEENLGLKIREDHGDRMILASVGTVIELYLSKIDFDPTGSPWLADE